jgi:hypothetical protein
MQIFSVFAKSGYSYPSKKKRLAIRLFQLDKIVADAVRRSRRE